MEDELNDTETAQKIWDTLPISVSGSIWGDEIRPASPVTVFGKLLGNPEGFKIVKDGAEVKIEKL